MGNLIRPDPTNRTVFRTKWTERQNTIDINFLVINVTRNSSNSTTAGSFALARIFNSEFMLFCSQDTRAFSHCNSASCRRNANSALAACTLHRCFKIRDELTDPCELDTVYLWFTETDFSEDLLREESCTIYMPRKTAYTLDSTLENTSILASASCWLSAELMRDK